MRSLKKITEIIKKSPNQYARHVYLSWLDQKRYVLKHDKAAIYWANELDRPKVPYIYREMPLKDFIKKWAKINWKWFKWVVGKSPYPRYETYRRWEDKKSPWEIKERGNKRVNRVLASEVAVKQLQQEFRIVK